MFRRGFSILFAVTMLTCPLICSAGAFCPSSARDAKQYCSCCCHKNAPATPEKREQPSPQKGDGCQCICGGAVQSEGASTLLARHSAQFVAIADFNFEVSDVLGDLAAPSAYFPDVGWIASGRELCCLHMTFQC